MSKKQYSKYNRRTKRQYKKNSAKTVIETVTEEYVPEDEKPVKDPKPSKQKRLTKEQKTELIMALDKASSNGKTKEDIASEFGISVSTVSYHSKKYGISLSSAKDKISDKEDPQSDIEPDDEDEIESKAIESEALDGGDLVELHKGKYIICGLVADRHSMPTRKYIFESIDEIAMFDYDRLDNTVKDFIKENIAFKNNVPSSGLSVYITGLPCCSASVIKVCHELKVNLKLKHYNVSTNKYATQVIWNQFPAISSIPDDCNTFDTILEKNIKLYINRSDFKVLPDIIKGHKFYMLTETQHEGFQYERYKILYSDMNDAFIKFGTVSERIQNEHFRTGVYIDRCYIGDDGILHNEINLAKGYNFRN